VPALIPTNVPALIPTNVPALILRNKHLTLHLFVLQVRSLFIPLEGSVGVPIRSNDLSAGEVSILFETVARSLSIQTQDISLHLWALTSAAAPKRLRSNLGEIHRDSRAVGELLKKILELQSGESLLATFEAKYMLQSNAR
jgi:hypothetical protein